MRQRGLSYRAALIAAALALGLLPTGARAFHSGGVGACDGCHAAHRKQDGTPPAPYLLEAADASSLCLNCHADLVRRETSVLTAGIGPDTAPVNYTPAGDYAWIQKSFAWIGADGQTQTSRGERHGHNVIAAQYGLEREATLTTAPGGTYPADKLSCISCHDPHGSYRVAKDGAVSPAGKAISGSGSYGDQATDTEGVGVYRLLAGQGYAPKSAGIVLAFSNNPPVAVAPRTVNKSERLAQVRVAYGAGMSEWCANCHGALHTPYAVHTNTSFLHPSGASAKLNQNAIARTYNMYVKTGDLSGSQLGSYWSLVPYEEGTPDTAVLVAHASSDGIATEGPVTGAENVMCLSCHRAHASAWDHAMRWNYTTEFVTVGGQWPGIDAAGPAASAKAAQGRTMSETRAAMYDRDPSAFSTFQNSLCNKCHGK